MYWKHSFNNWKRGKLKSVREKTSKFCCEEILNKMKIDELIVIYAESKKTSDKQC